MAAIFSSFYKTVAAANTPEAISATPLQFSTAIITGQRSNGSPNSDPVTVQWSAVDNSGSWQIYPGVSIPLIAPIKGIFDASGIFVDVITAGDGVLFTYCMPNPKAFNDIESKLEEALVRYINTIATSIDDCSVTAGITDDEKTADNITVYISSADERVQQSGNWDCQGRIIIQTNAARADSDLVTAAKQRHRLRTAYIRDLLMEPEAESILEALQTGLSVYAKSIRTLHCEQTVRERKWVSEFHFQITACGSDLI